MSAYREITTNTNENIDYFAGKSTAGKKAKAGFTGVVPMVNNNSDNNGIGDVVVAETGVKHVSKKTEAELKKEIANLQTIIDQKCIKAGLSKEEAKQIIYKGFDISTETFLSLEPFKQYKLLVATNRALDKIINDKQNNKIAKNVNCAEFVKATAKTYHKADMDCNVKDFEDFEKKSELNLDKNYKKSSHNKKIDILRNASQKIKQRINQERVAELEKCKNDAEREIVNQIYDKKINLALCYAQIKFIARFGEEEAAMSVFAVDGQSQVEATKNAYMFDDDTNQKIADEQFTHEFEQERLRVYYEEGDPISAEDYESIVECSMQYKSEEAIEQYQKDAEEFRQKVESGEVKADWMSEEHFEAEKTGIAKGIESNEFISDEKKVEFLNKINSSSKNEKVNNTCSELIKKVKADTSVKPEIAEEKVNGTEQKTTKTVRVKASTEELSYALTQMSYEEARKTYTSNTDWDFTEAVLKTPKLSNHKHQVIGYIKTLSAEDLNKITNGCTTEMFCYILRNISPDKAGQLYDSSIKNKCYAAKVLGEKIIKDNEVNEGYRNAAA